MSLADPYADSAGGIAPFPYYFSPTNPKFLPPITIGTLSSDFRWPYTYQSNFSLQRQLTNSLSLTASYVSSLSHKLPFSPDVNYPEYRPGATTANADTRRPYAGLSGITMVSSVLNSAYHGLQVNAEKRMSRSFSFRGFYTFSKALEGAESQSSTVGSGGQNERDRRAERARTGSDRRHNLVLSGIWQLNYCKNLPRPIRLVADGWTLSTVTSLRSGTGLTVTTGTDNNRDSKSGNDRPNFLGGSARLDPNRPRNEATARWFDTSLFVPNPVGTNGNSGRRIIDAPGLKNVNLGIARTFVLHEGMKLELRGDMTNAFNLVSLSGPNTSLSSSVFGTINSARGMREAQLSLRFAF